MFVAKARIIPVLDDWLGALSLKTVDQAITEMLVQAGAEKPEPTDITRARKIALEAQTKLERLMDAIEKGMGPGLYINRSRAVQAELAAARAVLELCLPVGPRSMAVVKPSACNASTLALANAPRHS
jgi:hypothetical protein